MDKKVSRDSHVNISSSSVSGNVIQTGDNNTATVNYQQVSLPVPESVDIQSELKGLREVLSQLETPDSKKIDNALSDAETELAKPETDKDEVGTAVERALKYAEQADSFTEKIQKIAPRVIPIAAWLESNWHKILGFVGLAA